MNNYRSGFLAEFLARSYMRFYGYKVIAKNFTVGKGSKAGEVDFVALKDKTLVFVEVKKRKDIDSAAYAISERQKSRVRKGAEAFLQQNKHFESYDIRFDAVLIQFPLNIVHIPDAF